MNKKAIEEVNNRIASLTQDWESNQVKTMQLQQELQRLVQVDQSLLGGISELKRILRTLTSETEEEPEKEEEKPNG